MAAKGKSGVEWKAELLTLLGGADDEQPMNTAVGGSPSHSDIDVLLVAPKSEKFVQRCLENELPPNMIHCLRLLRVLELQHAAQTFQKNEAQGKPDLPIKPISSRATTKVCQLLCTLCTDPSVGEQLRPHLFGLLALSGASYPASGVHVAKAASQVIVSFSDHCLSTSLVWFLHDRKMIVHMTDDIKELCGQTETPNNSTENGNSQSLYGSGAEAAGLWAISLSTVVHLVVYSCRHDCRELLKDFEAAKGNEVLKRAIMESKSMYGKKLMELLPLLASCRIDEKSDADNEEIASMADPDHAKLASNPAAFAIMEDLMYQTVPMLTLYMEENDTKPSVSSESDIRDIAAYSLQAALKTRLSIKGGKTPEKSDREKSKRKDDKAKTFDVATDLLLSALQLYSEHVRNYDLLEDECSFLTLYILAFPTIEDENLKVLILKTIEFVVTGITGSKALQPFSVLSEVFVSICKGLLEEGMKEDGDERKKLAMDGLFADTDLINDSLEKLFRFDGKVGPQIMQSGTITKMVEDIAQMLLKELLEKKDTWLVTFQDDEGNTLIEPPSSTPLDTVCAAILKVISLVMGYQAKRNAPLLSSRNESLDINNLLLSAVKELGDEAAVGASGVFEAIMISRENLRMLREDVAFVLGIVDYFSSIMADACGVSEAAKKILSTKPLRKSTFGEIDFKSTRKLNVVVLRRVSSILSMARKVLQCSSNTREAFRLSGGFESIIKVVISLSGSALHGDDTDEFVTALLSLFQDILSVVEAGIGFKARNEPADAESGALIPISLPANALVDPVSSSHGPRMPSAYNLYYLRLRAFYMDLAIAISQTKVLEEPENAAQVLELAMSHMDPSFSLTKIDVEKGSKSQSMRNPDGARLVLVSCSSFLTLTKVILWQSVLSIR